MREKERKGGEVGFLLTPRLRNSKHPIDPIAENSEPASFLKGALRSKCGHSFLFSDKFWTGP